MNSEDLKRFWAKVEKTPECWEWTGAKSHGYGYIKVGKKQKRAHRFAWEAFNGPVPTGDGYHGFCVLHKCDNRGCVNPNHLFLGSQKENMQDCWSKGRASQNGYKGGEAHLNSKLTQDQIRQIIIWGGNKTKTQREMARIFQVTQGHISKIVNKKRWNSNATI